MTARRLSLTFNNTDETAAFATMVGRALLPGDTILLSGDIGAGKTHFARSLIQSLQTSPEDVPSPTFTLVQTYDVPAGTIWHADLYRLTSTTEIEELGLAEAFDDAICVIEWPDRLGDLCPRDALDITLSSGDGDQTRHLSASWQDPKWDGKVSG